MAKAILGTALLLLACSGAQNGDLNGDDGGPNGNGGSVATGAGGGSSSGGVTTTSTGGRAASAGGAGTSLNTGGLTIIGDSGVDSGALPTCPPSASPVCDGTGCHCATGIGGSGGTSAGGSPGTGGTGSGGLPSSGGSGSGGDLGSGGSDPGDAGEADAGPCVCSSGPCCDGCLYRPKSFACSLNQLFKAQCGNMTGQTCAGLAQTTVIRDFGDVFCSGERADCDGSREVTRTTVSGCPSSELCFDPPETPAHDAYCTTCK